MKATWDESTARAYGAFCDRFDFYERSAVALITHLTKHLTKPTALLDVACGTGVSTRALATRSSDAVVVGIDSSLAMLNEAAGRPRSPLLHYVAGRAEDLPFRSTFDGAICNAALWQFDAEAALASMRTALAPGGIFVFNIAADLLNESTDVRPHDCRSPAEMSINGVRDLCIAAGFATPTIDWVAIEDSVERRIEWQRIPAFACSRTDNRKYDQPVPTPAAASADRSLRTRFVRVSAIRL